MEIQENNIGAVLSGENTSRFNGAVWYAAIQSLNISLAGLGGIGSYVCFLLSRLKPNHISVWDMDTVEYANMSGQMYGLDNMGSPKTSAMYRLCRNYSDYRDIITHGMFTEFESVYSVAICGFDNMAARKAFFNAWKRRVEQSERKEETLFIDGRLAMEEWQIFSFTGDNEAAISKYESEWLFDDSDAEETICSQKQTSFTANMIASFMVNNFVNFAANLAGSPFPRPIPFLIEYNAAVEHLKKEFV